MIGVGRANVSFSSPLDDAEDRHAGRYFVSNVSHCLSEEGRGHRCDHTLAPAVADATSDVMSIWSGMRTPGSRRLLTRDAAMSARTRRCEPRSRHRDRGARPAQSHKPLPSRRRRGL